MKGIIEIIVLFLLLILVISFLLGLYFLPTLIALVKHNINILVIFLLNLFTGWTFIGWIVLLIWAVLI